MSQNIITNPIGNDRNDIITIQTSGNLLSTNNNNTPLLSLKVMANIDLIHKENSKKTSNKMTNNIFKNAFIVHPSKISNDSSTCAIIRQQRSIFSNFTVLKPLWKKKLNKFLNSLPLLVFMSLITLFALFAADIQAAWLPIEVDEPFNIIQIMILVLFSIEFCLNCLAKDDYPFSFFFWLDLVATVSMIQDIDSIMNSIVGYEPISMTSGGSRKNTTQAAKAIAQVAHASRAARVLRIIKIVRLIRMVKLYKNVYTAKELAEINNAELKKKLASMEKDNISGNTSSTSSENKVNNNNKQVKPNKPLHIGSVIPEESHNNILEEVSPRRRKKQLSQEVKKPIITLSLKKKKSMKKIDEMDADDLIKESKISRIITDLITQKVIILIMCVLVIFPLLSDDFYTDDTSISYTLLAQMLANDYLINFKFENYTTTFNITSFFDESFPPINITYYNYPVYINPLYKNTDFRYKEVKSIYSDNASIQVVYSNTTETKLSGFLNFLQTIFVCCCLTYSAIKFDLDATRLVLEPLEIMMEIVEKVAKDPINAKNIEYLQTGIKASVHKTFSHKAFNNFEVNIIKSSIMKISALLAIGFGDAGCEIITKNLSSSHELNTKLRGKAKNAIFGFCDIRNFEQINLALEERTMLFINQIAEIVHSSVDKFKGATNKNIGDAFLNVWKFYNEMNVKGKDKEKIKIRKDNLLEIDPSSPQVAIVADCSVLAFLKIILKINKKWSILEYRKDEEILKRLPNFKLTMGFGLHLGYGIEGAVGSSYKIDASYLSPNVNIAARLESATRQFGISLLLSGTLYERLSPEMKNICRFVDCVMVRGSEQPLELYTIDLNTNITPENESQIQISTCKDRRALYAEKKLELQELIEENGSVSKFILERRSFQELIRVRSEEFIENWKNAISAYRLGNWRDAEIYLLKCKEDDPEDGPTKTLYAYIKKRNCIAPNGWYGVRELLSK